MQDITIVSMSRRPDLYKRFINDTENKLGDLIKQYIVFVNKDSIKDFYKQLTLENKKIRTIFASEDFVFKKGHDTVYNYLNQCVNSEYILKLFDTDFIEINKDEFIKELNLNYDIYGIPTHMQRGNVLEIKYQLYKKGVLLYGGGVHENPFFQRDVSKHELKNFKVYHNNALDDYSKNIKKNKDGFIILEKTEEGSDSDERNLLYEYWTYKIVNGAPHNALNWFLKHYEINKELIDWYAFRAIKKYNL